MSGNALEFSLVVPTFNEADNVEPLVAAVENALDGLSWEVVFVDDNSPDGTAAVAREMARRDPRVRCLERHGRRGLASACVEGWLASAAPVVGVIDADFQHDESALPTMIRMVAQGEADLVVGSRFAAGATVEGLSRRRQWLSGAANGILRRFFGVRLTDPMSGFFVMRRQVLEAGLPHLSAIGFKILLDLLLSIPRGTTVREVPFEFRERRAGESKLDARTAFDLALLLVDKVVGRRVPVRFIAFGAVGGLGIGVHFLVLTLLFKASDGAFVWAQAGATLAAMTSNFLLNNELTYRDRRIAGWGLLSGWTSFAAACSVGALSNVAVAGYLFAHDAPWLLAAAAGVAIGAVWNYAVTSVVTWSRT